MISHYLFRAVIFEIALESSNTINIFPEKSQDRVKGSSFWEVPNLKYETSKKIVWQDVL